MAPKKEKRTSGFRPIEVDVRPVKSFRPIEVGTVAAPVAAPTQPKPATGEQKKEG